MFLQLFREAMIDIQFKIRWRQLDHGMKDQIKVQEKELTIIFSLGLHFTQRSECFSKVESFLD